MSEKTPFTDCVDLAGSSVKKYDGTRLYVSTGALDCDHIDFSQVEECTYENKPSRANLVADCGTILFAKMQGTKKTIVLDDETSDYIYSTGFVAVRAKPDIISERCLYHLVTSAYFLRQKDKYCSGATQKAITNKGLEKIMIAVPDIAFQPGIADRLDLLDTASKLCRKILERLDDIMESRFMEMFGDPVNNEKGWDTSPLEGACISIVDCPHSTPSYTNENTGFMCIRTSIVKKNRILWDDIEYIPEDEFLQRIKRRKPQKGDVIYTREGAILGIAAIIDRDCDVALGQRSMLLTPDTTVCLSEFLSVAMNFDSFLHTVTQGVSGSASPHINVGDIRSYNIMLPPIDLQQTFAIFYNDIEKSKAAVTKCLKKAEYLKLALMQQYFG